MKAWGLRNCLAHARRSAGDEDNFARKGNHVYWGFGIRYWDFVIGD